MSENVAYLVNGLNPSSVESAEFQVGTNAVRIYGANLGVAYNILVLVGDPLKQHAWVPLWLNGLQIQLTDQNNVLVLFIAGLFKIVTSDNSQPAINALVYYQESIATGHDDKIQYTFETLQR